jgi:hypothetical protein
MRHLDRLLASSLVLVPGLAHAQDGGLPLSFVENRGQWPMPERFLVQRSRLGAAFGERSMRLGLGPGGSVTLAFEGAQPGAAIEGLGEPIAHFHFYLGADPAGWRADVPAYAGVRWRGLYPGVEVLVREQAGELEYDLLLAPEAELEDIVLCCEGTGVDGGLELGADGSLLLATRAGALRQGAPRTFELASDGSRRPLVSRFRLLDERRFGFEVEGRTEAPLVIDPGIEWSTFLGGSGPDFIGPAVPARDGSGDVFVGGTMKSPDFPLFSDPNFALGTQDRVFVVRLDPSGSVLRWATFLGGWHSQLVYRGLAVDASGRSVLCGKAYSPDFPTTPGAFDRVNRNIDAFVIRLEPAGSLIFSTFLGGSSEDEARVVAYDPAGNVVVGGTTSSSDFPTTPAAYDPTYNPPNAPADGGAHGDMFIARLTPDGTQLGYGTFLGGPQVDFLEDLAIDPQGFVTVCGWVTGNNAQVFVTTPDAFDRTWNGSQDAAIARLRLDGAGSADLKYATLIGGASQDNLWSLAMHPLDPELVTFSGRSWSSDFPVTPGVVRPTNPPFSELFPNVEAGIVVRFRFPAAGGGTRVWSTYHHADRITDLTVNEAGEPMLVGDQAPWDLSTTTGAFQPVARGSGTSSGSFLSRLDAAATRYQYQSFLGGSAGGVSDNFDLVPQVAHLSGNTVLVSGQTSGFDFPVTAGAADPSSSNALGGGASNEGVVLRIALDPDASGDLSAVPPGLVAPADGATFHNGLVGRIVWNPVADPSGIECYEYQVAVSPDFDERFLLWRGGIRETEALLPPSLDGSGGLAQTTFHWRVRTVDRAGNLSPWSPTRTFTVSPSSGRPTVAFLQVHPPSSLSSGVPGGTRAWGMLHLYEPAPAGGLVARISAHHDRSQGLDRTRSLPVPVSVPESVGIPAGALSAAFPIDTSPVTQSMPVTLVATIDSVGAQGGLSVVPPTAPRPVDVTLRPGTVTGGNPVTGSVTLSEQAPVGGTLVGLASSHPLAAGVPESVTVPAGARSASFPVSTRPVGFEIDAAIRATARGASHSRPLYVRSSSLPVLGSMTIAPTSVTGGSQAGGTLTFSAPIPLGTWPAFQDAVVRFTSSDPQAAQVSASDEFVPAGSTSHAFRIFTRAVPTTRAVTLGASFDGVVLSQVLTVGAVTGIAPSSLTANVTSLRGGEGGIATVHLAAPVPVVGGVYLSVSSSHPQLFSSLPGSVFVSSGSTSGSFPFVTSGAASAVTPVTLTVAYGASSASLGLSVEPPAAATPPVLALSLDPLSVGGGDPSTGTVTLAGAAPAGGAVVQLSSGNAAVASVPPSVTVGAGATSATFPVSTSAVAANVTVSIEALLHLGASMSLTVTAPPAPPGPPGTPSLVSPANDARPAQPVLFDWTDATSAASYELQIDSSSSFSLPLTAGVTTGVSQASVGGLPSQRLWWRVRASNSAGVAGNWSSSRRFTPQSAPAAPALATLSVSPTRVVGGSGATGTVALTAAAPSGGALVALASSSGVAGVPASVTVAAGATSTNFPVATASVASATAVTLSASYAGLTRSATLTVDPPPPPASLSALALSPASVTGGSSSTGTVTLTSAAPSGGLLVALASSNTAVAGVPSSVTVASGASSATFTVSTVSVSTATSVAITASAAGLTRTATLTVNAPSSGPLPAPTLLSPVSDARFSPGQTILFDWSDVAGAAGYTLLIDDSETFGSPIVDLTLPGSSFSTSSLPTSRMWWRVRASDPAGNPGSWSSARRFEVKD